MIRRILKPGEAPDEKPCVKDHFPDKTSDEVAEILMGFDQRKAREQFQKNEAELVALLQDPEFPGRTAIGTDDLPAPGVSLFLLPVDVSAWPDKP